MSARKLRFSIFACAAIFTLIVYAGSIARTYSAESDAEQPSAGDRAAAASSDAADGDLNLSIEQAKLADKFKDLERVLLRMAQVTEASDPKRAALLRQVFVQSKEKQVGLQFEDLVKLLQQEQLYQAGKGQAAVQQDLNRLLELLLTGDRDKQIPNERAEIKKFIERINKLIREEQGLQGETEGQGDPAELAKRQEGIGKKTQELEQELKKFDDRNKPAGAENADESGDTTPAEKADGESKSDDGKSTEKADGKSDGKFDKSEADKSGDQKSDKPDEAKSDKKTDDKKDSDDKKSEKPSDEKKSDDKSADDQKPAEKSDSKPSEKSDGKSSDSEKTPSESQSKSGKSQQKSEQQQGQQQQSEESDSESDAQQQNNEQQNNDESQARRRIREAQERMQEAKRRLEQAKRRGAAEEEQKAIDALQQAKAELEEILRQLREEEIERTLAMLEGRFRKMLQMQIEVYEGTVRLDRVPEDERDRDIEIEAAKLSRREAEITAEADKTLNLLREEGSSAAFPEAVDQMREDMESVTGRLARANVGQLTQGIEQDIVKALEEMITSLQKAQKEAQKRRAGGGGGGGGGGEQDQALVDQIAELKMIRALQLRVNTRTQRYSRMLDEGVEHAEQPDLVEAVRRLSEREERIYKTTRDIVVGRNK